MQQLILGVLAFALGLATIWRATRRSYRVVGALLTVGGVTAMLMKHPAHGHLAQEREYADNLCKAVALEVWKWSTPVSKPHEPPVANFEVDEVAARSAQALVLHDVLAPILRRCVAVWTDDCDHWLDALAIPEDDASPFEVPPRRARTAAALQEALRKRACPKYTPMQIQGT